MRGRALGERVRLADRARGPSPRSTSRIRSRSTSGARAASTSATEVIVMDLDLSQARRRAEEVLRAAQNGDEAALARMRPDRAPRLADAQRAVANDLGFPSWPALVGHVESSSGEPEERGRGVRRPPARRPTQ